MLVYRCVSLVSVASLLCLASAFSTRFVMEEAVEEGKKPQAVEETKTQKKEVNNSTEEHRLIPQAVEVEVIPIVTDVFSQADDLLNMTPLKLITTIAAQHLLTTVQNIPLAGDSPQDTLDMLGGIVKEFNKTAQIIRLTAEYVNISSHYILSTLEQYTKTSCEQKSLKESMKYVRKNFLKTIHDHTSGAIKELNEKTRQREMTGGDILVSSAYHIVTAFQEMTNQILTLSAESNNKCSSFSPSIEVRPPSGEQVSTTAKNTVEDILNVQVVPEQGKSHKSIKKDQATPKTENKATEINLANFQETIENLNTNQDLTVEVFSPEAYIQNNKKEQVVNKILTPLKDFKVDYIPFKTITFIENSNKEKAPEELEKNEQRIGNEGFDKELTSSAVDSLSNVPWQSSESEGKTPDKSVVVQSVDKVPQSFMNILELLAPGYQHPLQYQTKLPQCDEHVDPVCGIDRKNKKFIIFLNNCKREAHNRLFGTTYTRFSMDTCVGLFLRDPTLGAGAKLAPTNVDIQPPSTQH